MRKLVMACMAWRDQDRVVKVMAALGEKTVAEYYKLVDRRNQLRSRLAQAWLQQKLDVVVCPAHILPAIPHDTFGQVWQSGRAWVEVVSFVGVRLLLLWFVCFRFSGACLLLCGAGT